MCFYFLLVCSFCLGTFFYILSIKQQQGSKDLKDSTFGAVRKPRVTVPQEEEWTVFLFFIFPTYIKFPILGREREHLSTEVGRKKNV